MTDRVEKYGAKHWCEFCRIFVQNNPISRKNHDTGPKHKAQLERHLRNVYKRQDMKQKQDIKEAQMLQEIERKAAKAMGHSVSYRTGVGNVQKKPEPVKKTININDYGYDYDPTEMPKVEFKVTEEFLENNQREIGVGKLGEWEVVEDEIEQKYVSDDEDDVFTKAAAEQEEIPQKENEKKRDATEFEIVEKSIPIDFKDEVDTAQDKAESGEPVFKKFKSSGKKSFRKK
ncbi:hypothetical protein HDV04_001611 [Boothiomyces sp. JEL0838]|nr:hypothetical protein HDV04_001611 [Boothiomyces sp. JEL0838]